MSHLLFSAVNCISDLSCVNTMVTRINLMHIVFRRTMLDDNNKTTKTTMMRCGSKSNAYNVSIKKMAY